MPSEAVEIIRALFDGGCVSYATFDAAGQFVTKDDVASAIPCGPDPDAHVEAISEFVDWAETELLPARHGR